MLAYRYGVNSRILGKLDVSVCVEIKTRSFRGENHKKIANMGRCVRMWIKVVGHRPGAHIYVGIRSATHTAFRFTS